MAERELEISMPDLGLSSRQISRLETQFSSLVVDELAQTAVSAKSKSKEKIKVKTKTKNKNRDLAG